ncbi:MAG: hypothetical protein IAE63_04055 [Alphaproteobacteria bacterium]|nr:hypothetical protein [Alphaproteobacteria bacterium]
MKLHLPVLLVTALVSLSGCQTNSMNQVMETSVSQVQTRQMQTRAFDTTDKKKTLRTVIATLQDLGFVIDKADNELGSVSGTKLDGYSLRMTVTVRPKGKKQTSVRTNATYNVTPVEDPQPYQQFFVALEKAMFLTAHEVD